MNRQAANYQNTDEAKANPFPNLPDVLTLKSGEQGVARKNRGRAAQDHRRRGES
jgi:hypothetical protein